MLYVKQIKFPEFQILLAPNFNLETFPAALMHGNYPEIVDLKDKGFSGKVNFHDRTKKLKLLGEMKNPGFYVGTTDSLEPKEGELSTNNILVIKLN